MGSIPTRLRHPFLQPLDSRGCSVYGHIIRDVGSKTTCQRRRRSATSALTRDAHEILTFPLLTPAMSRGSCVPCIPRSAQRKCSESCRAPASTHRSWQSGSLLFMYPDACSEPSSPRRTGRNALFAEWTDRMRDGRYCEERRAPSDRIRPRGGDAPQGPDRGRQHIARARSGRAAATSARAVSPAGRSPAG